MCVSDRAEPNEENLSKYKAISSMPPFLQANNATLNVHIGLTVKTVRSVATVKTEAVVTTFQALALAPQDGEELCK